jgi:hypothetical protein
MDQEGAIDEANEPSGTPRLLKALSVSPDKEPWTLELAPGVLRGAATATRASFEIPHADTVERLNLVDGLFLARCISIKEPKVMLQLDAPGFRTLKDWIGQPLLLRGILKMRLQWNFPIGVLFLLLALPLGGDPESGVPAVPFNIVNAVLGGLLIVSGLMGQRWPHHRYLLMDSLWWAILGATTITDVLGGAHKAWLLLLLLQVRLCYTGIRDWHRFQLGRY